MISGSIIIFGGNEKNRADKADEVLKGLFGKKTGPENIDIRRIEVLEDKKSIGIDQVKDAIKYLNEKPYSSDFKSVVFADADKLTIEAQNALLKILEEPPAYANILLCTKTEESLLPTVRSRCKKIIVEDEKRVGEYDKKNSIREILSMSAGKRLSWAEEFSKEEKDDAIKLLENWVYELRENLPNSVMIQNRILETKTDLESTNVNVRLALESLLFKV